MTAFEPSREQIESVWRSRATRLAKRPNSTAVVRDEVHVLVVAIGEERYGVDLASVAAVLAPVACTPVPGAVAALVGVIEVQGEIRPVLDLGKILGLTAANTKDLWPVVLLRRRGRQMGLRVERTERIQTLDRNELSLTGNAAAGVSARYVESLTRDTLMLLSAQALFSEVFPEGKTEPA